MVPLKTTPRVFEGATISNFPMPAGYPLASECIRILVSRATVATRPACSWQGGFTYPHSDGGYAITHESPADGLLAGVGLVTGRRVSQ